MKTYKYTETIHVDTSSISATPEDILYFDIETTGLSADRSDLYLIGLGFYQDGFFNTVFLFNDDGCSEPEMLDRFANYITRYSYLVSYNGDTFDIPYIQTKMKQFDIDCTFSGIHSVDIYKTTRKYKKLFNMSSVRQVDVEELVGFKRNIFISGGTLISTYKEYLHSRSDKLLNDLMTHNHDDVRGLISITEFLNLPLVIDKLEICSIDHTGDSLEFICNLPVIPCRIIYSSNNIRINAIGKEAHIYVPIVQGIMKYYFKDWKNYYYLPMEHMAIHKSMAVYVDNDHKEKATKYTAFTTSEGRFIPAPPALKDNVFYDSDMNGDRYIKLSDELLSTGSEATLYLQEQLAAILPSTKKNII